ncbi:MAG: ATP-binding protein, partial [bacterium]
MKKYERYFNTSGPCIPTEHYTLMRPGLIAKGKSLVEHSRYFTIWAPRQTGKSTYFTLLCEKLNREGCIAIWINVEGLSEHLSYERVVELLIEKIKFKLRLDARCKDMAVQGDDLEGVISSLKGFPFKVVLVIDEIERFTPAYFNEFLHLLRETYHDREHHSLKSVILVGVSNILGIIQDNASPFNIADNLNIPYFSQTEVKELLGQHEKETGQQFTDGVKEKVYQITQGQPGLVNGFAYKLVDNNPNKEKIDISDYLQVEDWYLRIAIDKNIENIKNKARRYKKLVEELLFTENEIKFDTTYESIKFLHANGVIREGESGNIEFWVPLYKKKLYKAFSPDYNGEYKYFFIKKDQIDYFDQGHNLDLDDVIKNFGNYVKERSFKYFMKRKEDGSYEGLKEAAAGYAFSTYIDSLVRSAGGQVYYETDSGLGRTDMIINVFSKEYVLEFKIFIDGFKFNEGKKQVSYYSRSRGLSKGYYVVFASCRYKSKEFLREQVEEIEGVQVKSYIIWYDEERDFGSIT